MATLVVLAAGMSTRYGRLKQVDPMGPCGASIMDYNVYDALRAGFSEVAFVTRPEIENEVRDHVSRIVGDALPVRVVLQTLDDVPPGFSPPPDRIRPWGTAHAVLSAADEIRGPFGVCNADDLYGAVAFESLHRHLSSSPLSTEAALVGYTLENTLSGQGGVSRGICVLGRDRLLESVTEIREIRRVEGWIQGEDDDGLSVDLRGHEVVSMNLWGFSGPVIKAMRRQFRRFLERWGADTTAEFPLSTALSEQVQVGSVRVAVLPGGDAWFGVTHPADMDRARAALASRIAGGLYPEDLIAAFRSHG
jgi:choline kinase